MNFYVAVTDYEWFRLHASKASVEEVNFWRPSPDKGFNALKPGEMLLFKLHSPRNFIVGGGFFTRFLRLPISLAWDSFGEANGVKSFAALHAIIAKHRHSRANERNPSIGCIMLGEPFFFPDQEWIPCPSDFALNTVQGKTYSTETSRGRDLWVAIGDRLARRVGSLVSDGPATIAASEGSRYGKPLIVEPRLGQGIFRVLVTDAYDRRCAMTNERTLPVLQAAHIKPYAEGGSHEIKNGLLLRSDLHTLFDQGYLTIDPTDHRIVVSRRIREEFENGRHYYELEGNQLRLPLNPEFRPSAQCLEFHSQNRFI